MRNSVSEGGQLGLVCDMDGVKLSLRPSAPDFLTHNISGKIQRAEQMKVHTMFVIGKRDMEANAVSVRVHGKGNLGAKPRAGSHRRYFYRRSNSDALSHHLVPRTFLRSASISRSHFCCSAVKPVRPFNSRKILRPFSTIAKPSSIDPGWTFFNTAPVCQ